MTTMNGERDTRHTRQTNLSSGLSSRNDSTALFKDMTHRTV